MRKKGNLIHIYVPDELKDWLATQSKTQTDLVIDGLNLVSKIDYETIEKLADEHRIHPDLLVDAAVMYFAKLEPDERKSKIADYLENNS